MFWADFPQILLYFKLQSECIVNITESENHSTLKKDILLFDYILNAYIDFIYGSTDCTCYICILCIFINLSCVPVCIGCKCL